MSITCGEATMQLLARYGISTVFGIPGVHTLDMCRGLSDEGTPGTLRHVRARNEQGAGFMAEGWARATGEVGVAVVISGPGVTNTATALAQCYCDSLPLLLISAEQASYTIGKNRGVLHEVSDQRGVTEPITALSARARRAADVPEILAQAFAIFSSRRSRPVHLAIPIDVQREIVSEDWKPVVLPARPTHTVADIKRAAAMLRGAASPLVFVGGGATAAGADLAAIAEATGAIVLCSSAGKGIVRDNHPQSLGAGQVRPEVRAILPEADVILAVGTELSETDVYVERLDLQGQIIRVDIDPAKINDFYPATLGIVGDAGPAMAALRAALEGSQVDRTPAERRVTTLRKAMRTDLTPSEVRHVRVLDVLRDVAPPETIWSGDACQIVYTGAFAMPVQRPRQWFFPAGYCALGNALPNAIGAMLARPGTPVAVLVGDGGFQFTMQELLVAAELGLSLPIILWDNAALKQIRDDMDLRDIPRVGVEGLNPDFLALAGACHCHASAPTTEAAFRTAFTEALYADRPTLIVLREGEGWLA